MKLKKPSSNVDNQPMLYALSDIRVKATSYGIFISNVYGGGLCVDPDLLKKLIKSLIDVYEINKKPYVGK